MEELNPVLSSEKLELYPFPTIRTRKRRRDHLDYPYQDLPSSGWDHSFAISILC
jgi:hypothetical protein